MTESSLNEISSCSKQIDKQFFCQETECGIGLFHHDHPVDQPVPPRGEGDLTPILSFPSIIPSFLHFVFLAFASYLLQS